MKRTILLFIDGLGWGLDDPEINPQCSYGGKLLGFPLWENGEEGLWLGPNSGQAHPIDAILDVPGVPQSATGQTTLLTGINAQAKLGKHLTGFPNAVLRGILLEHSLLKKITEGGFRARFLNAFRPRFFDLPRERQLMFSATTVSNLAADLPFFTLDDLEAGRSIYQEFTNRELIERGFPVRPVTPVQAGGILARQSLANNFTLFEYFQTDRAGHSRDWVRCREELVKLDEFLFSLLEDLKEELSTETLVLLTSDHGNLEDLSTRRHTMNPVPLAAWGRDAGDLLEGVDRLDQVAGAILARHGLGG
ncbi:MAG: alkaline phosphatase family protein [Gemmatimonadales bacterium]|nr:alkaline phosphatase family protein [Gemmatimonadales bacterium]